MAQDDAVANEGDPRRGSKVMLPESTTGVVLLGEGVWKMLKLRVLFDPLPKGTLLGSQLQRIVKVALQAHSGGAWPTRKVSAHWASS